MHASELLAQVKDRAAKPRQADLSKYRGSQREPFAFHIHRPQQMIAVPPP